MSLELTCLFDSDLEIIRVNQTWAKVFGIAESVAAGRSFLEFVPTQQHHQIETDLANLEPEMRTLSCTHAIGFGNHVTARVEWTYRKIMDESGVTLGYEALGYVDGSAAP